MTGSNQIDKKKKYKMTTKIQPMIRTQPKQSKLNNMHLTILLIQIAVASEWNAPQNFKKELEASINEAREFEKNVGSLEFTALHIKEYSDNSYDVIKFCCDVVSIENQNETLTVVEIKKNTQCTQDQPTIMLDIVSLLYDYASNNSKNESYTNNIEMKAYIIKNKHLQGFEMLNGDTNSIKKIDDMIHIEIVSSINDVIENTFINYIKMLLFEVTGRYILEILNTNQSIDISKEGMHSEILKDVFALFTQGQYKNLIEEFVTDYSNYTERYVEHLVSNVMKYQKTIGFYYYNKTELKAKMRYLYQDQQAAYIFRYVNQIKSNILDSFMQLTYHRLVDLFEWFIIDIFECLSSDNIAEAIISTSNLEEICHIIGGDLTRLDKSNREIFEDLRLFTAMEEARNENFSSNLVKLKPPYHQKSLKIVVNGKITKENIRQFVHILNNINMHISGTRNQIICINMKKGFDLMTISRRFEKLSASKNDNAIRSLVDNSIANKKLTLIYKRNMPGIITKCTIYLLPIIEAAALAKTEGNLIGKIYGIISCKASWIMSEKNKKIVIDRDNIDDQLKSSIYIHLYIDKILVKIMFSKNMHDANYSIIVLAVESTTGYGYVDMMDTIALPKLVYDRCEPAEHYRNENPVCISRKRYLTKLNQYLRNVQMLSNKVDLPVFTCRESEKYFVEEIMLSFQINDPFLLDDKTRKVLNNLHRKIKDFLTSDSYSANCVYTKIYLSDILMRKINQDIWSDTIRPFLSLAKIRPHDFENIIDKYLIDQNRINATNDSDLLDINLFDYKIMIYAIPRLNMNTLIYFVRADIEYDLSYSLPEVLLEVYTDIMNNSERYKDYDEISYMMHIKSLSVNPVPIIFRAILDLKFNMLDDIVEQFEENKDAFYKQFYSLINQHLMGEIPIDRDLKFGTNINTKGMTLVNTILIRYLNKEIDFIFNRIRKKQLEIRSKRYIRVTAVSLKKPDSDDLDNIETLFKKLEECQ